MFVQLSAELAGKSDDKLKMMDAIEALKAKRAEIQVLTLA